MHKTYLNFVGLLGQPRRIPVDAVNIRCACCAGITHANCLAPVPTYMNSFTYFLLLCAERCWDKISMSHKPNVFHDISSIRRGMFKKIRLSVSSKTD